MRLNIFASAFSNFLPGLLGSQVEGLANRRGRPTVDPQPSVGSLAIADRRNAGGMNAAGDGLALGVLPRRAVAITLELREAQHEA
jgi:hypothetical protein